jgi:hypothetical protein
VPAGPSVKNFNHTGRMIMWNKIGLACGEWILYFIVTAEKFVLRDYFRKGTGGRDFEEKTLLLILPPFTAK